MTDEKDKQQAKPLEKILDDFIAYANKAIEKSYEVGPYERSVFDNILTLAQSVDTWL